MGAAIISAVSAAVSSFGAEPNPPTRVPTGVYYDLVRQLGDPSYPNRETATKALIEHPDAETAVRRALDSTDPEVVRRATDILKAYEALKNRKVLERLRAAVGDKRPDLLVEYAVNYCGDDNDVWQLLTDMGWSGVAVGQRNYGRLTRAAEVPFPNRSWLRERELKGNGYHVLPPETTVAPDGGGCFRGPSLWVGRTSFVPLVAATGKVGGEEYGLAFVFSNGGLTLRNASAKVVALCDGDYEQSPSPKEPRSSADNSFVVVRGEARLPHRLRDSVILATGDVIIPEGAWITGSTIRAGGTVRTPKQWEVKMSDIRDGVPDATKPFRFFEPAQVGLEVLAGGVGGIRLGAVDAKSAFAAAGVGKDDFIMAVNGKSVATSAEFRKRLRSAFVAGSGTFSVRTDRAPVRDRVVKFPD